MPNSLFERGSSRFGTASQPEFGCLRLRQSRFSQ
jgi:hypothetical protein